MTHRYPLGAARRCAILGALALSTLLPLQSARAQSGERCFGALGMECGPQSNLLPTALCGAGICRINAGSWEHDECCWANRNSGKSCIPTAQSPGQAPVCNASWQKALSRLSGGWSWTRQVDFSRYNATGKVERSLYCAVKGSLIHKDDVKYCCSRSARMQTFPGNANARLCN